MATGTIYLAFTQAGATEVVRAGENRAAGTSGWEGAATDEEWQAEQEAFLDLSSEADEEALSVDE